jgi:undecaprenyl-diphosphatase
VDFMLLLKAAVMGVVEGLTEFLPISSTGHLILAGALLGFDDEKAKVFDIAIQTGAIFAVIIVYWQKIASTVVALPTQRLARRFVLNVFIAFVPAVVLGLLFGNAIKAHLFTPTVVASSFIIGGFIILWVEGWGRKPLQEGHPDDHARIVNVESMTPMDALKVGLVQCLAMVPGTSRSGATIIGGMLLGMSRKAATDFSFYLAIPTLIGAGAYSLYKERALLSMADLPMFVVGLVFSFLSAWLVCVGYCAISQHTTLSRLLGIGSALVPSCWSPPIWAG